MNKKYIIIFGSSGTLGSELKQILELYGFETLTPSHLEVDVTNYDLLSNFFKEQHGKNIIAVVNCSALVNTVGIETSFEIRNKSFLINVVGVRNIAEICNEYKINFIHISTDYVFSEFSERGIEFPVNIYGYHKLISELFIKSLSGLRYTVMRVGWIYGYKTKRTFIHKFITNVINNIKMGKNEVECVSDQISTPTSVKFVSK